MTFHLKLITQPRKEFGATRFSSSNAPPTYHLTLVPQQSYKRPCPFRLNYCGDECCTDP